MHVRHSTGAAPWALVCWLVGCGPAVDAPSGGSDTSAGDATLNASVGESTLATTTDGAGPATGTSDGTTGIDSTGTAWTWTGDEAHTELRCSEGAGQLNIEIYPGMLDGACPPDPGIEPDDLVLVVIDGWDGSAASFAVGPAGPARMAVGLQDPFVGEVAIDVDAPWSPAVLHLDASNGSSSFVGDADLSLCVAAPAVDPCAG